MTTLDTVLEMQKKGMTDFEISKNLQSQGISPKEINDALNQAKVKSAVGGNTNMQPQPSITETGQAAQSFPQENIQQSATNQMQNTQAPQMQQQNQGQIQQQNNPQPLQMPGPSQNPGQDMSQGFQPQPSIMGSYQPPQSYPQDALYSEDQYYQDPYASGGGDYYGGDDYYGGGGYGDAETMTEIAEQVVNEKFKEYNRKTGDMAMFKTMMQDKVNIIEQRLKRIEDNMDKLQQAIIQKIGEFGENSSLIRRDLEALHNTTSKLMNPLIDHYREIEKKKK